MIDSVDVKRLSASALNSRLDELLRHAGFFRNSYGYYLGKLIIVFSGLAGVQYALMLSPEGGWRFLYLVAWALFSGILGTVGHDAGHGVVSSNRVFNSCMGYLCMPFANGNSYRQWKTQHLLHHVYLQMKSKDPDVNLGMPSFRKFKNSKLIGIFLRFIARHQVIAFWSLALFYSFVKRASTMRNALKKPSKYKEDLFFFFLHYAIFLGLPIYLLGGQGATNYIAYSFLLSLYYSIIFSVNHIGRHQEPANTDKTVNSIYIIEHTRSIRTYSFIHLIFGGLTLHTAHHLFPEAGVDKLRKGDRIIEHVCREFGIEYQPTTLWRALKEVNLALAGEDIDELIHGNNHSGKTMTSAL